MNYKIKSTVLSVILLSIVINFLWMVPAFYSLLIFDKVLPSRSLDTLVVLFSGVAAIIFFASLLEYIRGKLQISLGDIFLNYILPIAIEYTHKFNAIKGKNGPSALMRDISKMKLFISSRGLLSIIDAPWAFIFIFVIWLINTWLGLFAFFSVAALVIVAIINDILVKSKSRGLQELISENDTILNRGLYNSEVAYAMGMVKFLTKEWIGRNGGIEYLADGVNSTAIAMSVIAKVLRQGTQIFMVSLGAYLVLEGLASPGIMIASSMLLNKALQPIEQIVSGWGGIMDGKLAWSGIRKFLLEVQSDEISMRLPEPVGSLSVDKLFYRVEGSGEVILANISFDLLAGESLAIVGPSGAGKSTLVRLLVGLWKPTQGNVRLDGADLFDWPRDGLAPHIGYLPQKVELFPGTIAENIARMGEVDPEKVVEASKLASVHELILGLPNGYNYVIDPQSSRLSPGQRQRIALARALYGRPKFVILDEPNSNIDGFGEQALAQTVRDLRGNTTVILVTHRPSLTHHVEKILVLENGRIVQFGLAEKVMTLLRKAAIPPTPGRLPPTSE